MKYIKIEYAEEFSGIKEPINTFKIITNSLIINW